MGNVIKMLIIVLWSLTSGQVIASPALPGEKCQVTPHSSWSETEAWTWGEICAGEIADLSRWRSLAPDLVISQDSNTPEPVIPNDPESLEGWDDWDDEDGDSEKRKLSQNFIEMVLLHDPWRSSITRQGVRIRNAVFPEGIDLVNAQIEHEFKLIDCRFLRAVNFSDSSFSGLLSLEGSTFERMLDMSRVSAKTVYLLENAHFKGVVDLRGADVKYSLEMDGSTFEGIVILNNARVYNLFMRGSASFKKDINLIGARVGGTLDMKSSSFEGEVEMDDFTLGSNLIMNEATFTGEVRLRAAEIGGLIDLSDSIFNKLNLSGTHIAGELWLYSSDGPTRWLDGGELILRNTRVTTFQDGILDKEDAWPAAIQLAGFSYDRLGGSLGSAREADMLARDSDWYINWLARDPGYSPQPYEQLAAVFRASGYPSKANDILYAGRERERKNAIGAFRLGLEALKLTIGYGLGKRYFRALWWVAGLVALGMVVLRISGEGIRNRMPYGFAFSLDHLLPVIHLRKYHFDITLHGWARYYFYVHKLMGYVLASFLIAGMAGLTQ